METKHTPGEWYLPHFADKSTSCNCPFVLSEKYAGSICVIDIDNGKPISDGGNDSPPLEEAIANAKLITAAPVLLEACIEALRYHQGGHSEIGFKLREAIKKATE